MGSSPRAVRALATRTGPYCRPSLSSPMTSDGLDRGRTPDVCTERVVSNHQSSTARTRNLRLDRLFREASGIGFPSSKLSPDCRGVVGIFQLLIPWVDLEENRQQRIGWETVWVEKRFLRSAARKRRELLRSK